MELALVVARRVVVGRDVALARPGDGLGDAQLRRALPHDLREVARLVDEAVRRVVVHRDLAVPRVRRRDPVVL